MKVIIPMKLPSLNEYINWAKINKGKWNKANQMKQDIQNDMMFFINKLPTFEKPIKITFTWVEENKKRDLDNICFAKKFILDALVKAGKIKNDNYKYVKGFIDKFEYSDTSMVIIDIEEV